MTEPNSSAIMRRIVRGACSHDCPDTCAWTVTVEDGVATQLRGDTAHPFTRGGLCAKVNRFIDRVYSPHRVLYPMRRTGPKGEGRFKRVSWNEALDEIASRLATLVATYGGETVLPYTYAGTQGFVQFASIDRRFFARLGATRLERNLCGDTANAGMSATQGNAWGIDPEDLRHSRLIVLWGTNTVVTNLHLWPFILEARARGATVVAVDPVRTRTAEQCDWHVQPRPGTDAALALGMMHVIVRDGLHDVDYIERYTSGFDALARRLQEYPPERAASLTGIPVDDIERLARAYADTQPAAIRQMIGMEHHENGAMMFRTIACLPALVGAWRHRGGGLTRSMYSYPIEALDMDGLIRPDLEDPRTRSVNMARLGEALTDPAMAPPVHGLLVHSCNPATIAPNQALVRRGLARDDLFTVVLDQFVTDTARFADFLLPATTELEHLDIVPSWGHLYIALNKPAISPLGESVANTEFFRRLSRAMGLREAYLQEDDESLVRGLLASGHPWLAGITYERLERDGWARLALPEDWRPFAEGGFPTASGRLEFYSQALASRGFDPLPAHVPPRESLVGGASRYPLQLLTTRAVHFLNSQYVNFSRQRTAEREPLLDLNVADADARSIQDGEWVRVFNDRGAVRLRARRSAAVRQGVVTIPYAWWGTLAPGGGTANTLTSDRLSDWGGGCAFHDTLVEVVADQKPARDQPPDTDLGTSPCEHEGARLG